jgi:4-amino-4-deoxy-L-arabinose transferase-like glycosyltransferase
VRWWAAAAIGAYFLFFFRLGGMGLVGPDEPRYAAVAREMAQSGDWVTPRLWGEPWFEKPVLLYWLAAAGFRLGLGEEMAPRLPVAALSVGFLAFFFWRLRREFRADAAAYATAILATSAGWVGYSHAAVFDVPLAATLGAAMLLLMSSEPALVTAGALLGASMLAKGLVGPALAGLALAASGRWWTLLRPRLLAGLAAVAGPWYLACWARNGGVFLEEFVWKHHVTRFAAGALEHNQPFWFFLPVLALGLLPWTPVYWLTPWRERQTRFLLVWAAVTVLFFSVSRDKLPGYVLPALPALAALAGVGLARAEGRRPWALAASALLLGLVPVAAAVLPEALNTGLTRALSRARAPLAAWAAVAALAAVVWMAERRGGRKLAVGFLAAAAVTGYAWMKQSTFPAIDRQAGARALWLEARPHAGEVCVGEVRRHLVYGLNYYAGRRLPACADEPKRRRIEESGVVVSLEP